MKYLTTDENSGIQLKSGVEYFIDFEFDRQTNTYEAVSQLNPLRDRLVKDFELEGHKTSFPRFEVLYYDDFDPVNDSYLYDTPAHGKMIVDNVRGIRIYFIPNPIFTIAISIAIIAASISVVIWSVHFLGIGFAESEPVKNFFNAIYFLILLVAVVFFLMLLKKKG